jgi:hypothetical protein
MAASLRGSASRSRGTSTVGSRSSKSDYQSKLVHSHIPTHGNIDILLELIIIYCRGKECTEMYLHSPILTDNVLSSEAETLLSGFLEYKLSDSLMEYDGM